MAASQILRAKFCAHSADLHARIETAHAFAVKVHVEIDVAASALLSPMSDEKSESMSDETYSLCAMVEDARMQLHSDADRACIAKVAQYEAAICLTDSALERFDRDMAGTASNTSASNATGTAVDDAAAFQACLTATASLDALLAAPLDPPCIKLVSFSKKALFSSRALCADDIDVRLMTPEYVVGFWPQTHCPSVLVLKPTVAYMRSCIWTIWTSSSEDTHEKRTEAPRQASPDGLHEFGRVLEEEEEEDLIRGADIRDAVRDAVRHIHGTAIFTRAKDLYGLSALAEPTPGPASQFVQLVGHVAVCSLDASQINIYWQPPTPCVKAAWLLHVQSLTLRGDTLYMRPCTDAQPFRPRRGSELTVTRAPSSWVHGPCSFAFVQADGKFTASYKHKTKKRACDATMHAVVFTGEPPPSVVPPPPRQDSPFTTTSWRASPPWLLTDVRLSDAELVETQADVSRVKAVESLLFHDGDVVNAIMELTV